jgi:hypothetical protein
MKSANNLNQFVNKEWHTVLTPSSHPGVALKHFLRVDTIFFAMSSLDDAVQRVVGLQFECSLPPHNTHQQHAWLGSPVIRGSSCFLQYHILVGLHFLVRFIKCLKKRILLTKKLYLPVHYSVFIALGQLHKKKLSA